MKTIGSVLEEQKGIGPGFLLLRMLLAISVIYVHGSLLDGAAAAEQWWPYGARWALNNFAVPMFFVMSGFLVTGSMMRSRVDEFLVNRLVRLVPGLIGVILVSALVLGPLVTTASLSGYFGDRSFYTYLLNAVGLHRDALPGVFQDNPETLVNGSLWTLPHEVACYLLLSLLAATGALRRRSVVLGATIALYAIAILLAALDRSGDRFPFSAAIDYIFLWRGAAHLVPLFLTGVLFYQYRERIPFNALVAAAAGLGLIAFALAGTSDWQDDPLVWAASAPMFGYAAMFLGLSGWFVLPILAGVDYSYGIFLYGYPVEQTLSHLMRGSHNYPVYFLASLAVTLILAALSWHFIEKPALALRKPLRARAAAVVERLSALIRPSGRAQPRIEPGA